MSTTTLYTHSAQSQYVNETASYSGDNSNASVSVWSADFSLSGTLNLSQQNSDYTLVSAALRTHYKNATGYVSNGYANVSDGALNLTYVSGGQKAYNYFNIDPEVYWTYAWWGVATLIVAQFTGSYVSQAEGDIIITLVGIDIALVIDVLSAGALTGLSALILGAVIDALSAGILVPFWDNCENTNYQVVGYIELGATSSWIFGFIPYLEFGCYTDQYIPLYGSPPPIQTPWEYIPFANSVDLSFAVWVESAHQNPWPPSPYTPPSWGVY